MTSCLQKCKTNLSKMKTFTQTFTRNITQEPQTNLWLLSNRAGNFLKRFFVFGFLAPVGAYSIKGGSFRTQRDTLLFVQPNRSTNSQFIFSNKEFSK